MRVREENRNILLLASVALMCASIVLVVTALDFAPSKAQAASQQAALADPAPVRVVGVPFVPNTNPREHQ